ncbi:MAG: hypothetical protein JXP73_15715 [Deltaproteobacteria bacterium]|nr:hypothetical protein [Deltaproteobacteria bacterium]
MNDSLAAPSHTRLLAYFVPLALQAASQSLTYPLVAMVASHGPGGALNLAGVAQSNIVMFLIATLGAGLVTAGMVFARTRAGYAHFVAVNHLLSLVTAAIQAVICIPAVGHLVFGTLLRLPASIETAAAQAFPLTILLNLLFYARNPYQVLLYNHGAAGRASAATFARIALTLVMAPLFCAAGLVGPRWAMVCQAIPVALETAISRWYSRPFAAALPADSPAPPSARKILLFTLPLSLGGFLLTLSSMILGGVIARAAYPERMLPAYYLAVGLANPAAYAASRVQNVVIAFPPRSREDNRVLRFSAVAGAGLSFVPLLFLLPGLAQWYYLGVQRLPPADLPLVYTTALLFVAFPFTVALRCHREGLAALAHRTPTILAGDIAYVATLAVAASLCLTLQVPGNVIGPLVVATSNVASLGILVLLLREPKADGEPPVAPVVGPEG